VENGFKNDCDINREASEEEKIQRKENQRTRWKDGLKMYPKFPPS
jgi:hypothetical protein